MALDLSSNKEANILVREDGDKIILNEGSNQIIVRPASVTKVRSYINAGEKFFLNGDGGDSYFTYNDTTNRLELWVNGKKQSEWA